MGETRDLAAVEALRRCGLVEVDDNVRRAHALLAESRPWLDSAMRHGAYDRWEGRAVLAAFGALHRAGDALQELLAVLDEVRAIGQRGADDAS